ncbi:MAG TPA: ABC transporter permease, partial [Longimicrobiaceae bacterium]|nr:ABC transporter permease [Longimicrobiaceae bacterium]
CRFALRHFARTPWTTLTMFVVLVGGMSIATLLFSYVHSYAVQPPPGMTRQADLVRIRGSQGAGVDGRGHRGFSEEELRGYRELTGPFAAVAGWTDARLPLVLDGDAERRTLEASVTFVTESYFSVLGLRPALGAGLPAAEGAGPAAVAVIGHATWERLFAGSPAVLGSAVTVNGVPVTIVGVAPERFNGVSVPYSSIRLWIPLSARRLLLPGQADAFRAAARLRPGVGLETASAAVRVVAARTAAADPQLRATDPTVDVVPLLAVSGDPMFDRDVWLMTLLVGLLGLLVLLVACTNASALLTGLATARRHEIAVRLSLGAARSRLVRQLLTESALLASAAGAAALGVVWLVLRTVTRLIPGLPFEVGITWPATAFTFGVALAVGVGFGLSPALHATRLALASVLRDSAAGVAAARGRLQRGLVVAQVTFTQPLIVLLAVVLLIVLGHLQPTRPTALSDRLVRVSLQPPVSPAGGTPAAEEARVRMRAAASRLTDRLPDTPGVEAVVVEWPGESPLGAYAVHPADRAAGAPEEAVRLSGERAARGYFGAMGIPVVRGREFAPAEAGSAEPGAAEAPIVVGAELARRLWAGADPLGRRLRSVGDSAAGARTLVVVGVIEDPLADARRAGDAFRIYLPPDTSWAPRRVLVRTAGAAEPLLPAVRAAVQEETGGMLAEVRTLADVEDELRRNLRLAAGGISGAGLVALLLSAIGLYAVVAFTVGQRTREIAVRMAVGAPGGTIVRRFVADGIRLGVVGLVLGLPFSLLGVHLLLSADADFPPLPVGPVTAIAALGVLAVATAAAWIPARRAAAVDPAITLRSG